MPSLSESEPTGCLSWIAAYCLGSYLMAPLLNHILGLGLNIALAPFDLPTLFGPGPSWLLLAGSTLYFAMAAFWIGLIIAAVGLIRIVTHWQFHWWPMALIVAIYALALIPKWL